MAPTPFEERGEFKKVDALTSLPCIRLFTTSIQKMVRKHSHTTLLQKTVEPRMGEEEEEEEQVASGGVHGGEAGWRGGCRQRRQQRGPALCRLRMEPPTKRWHAS